MRRRTSPISATSCGSRDDELLGIGLCLPHGLRLASRELFFGHDCSIAELLRPLERNSELIVGREEPLNVGITPRGAEMLIGARLLSLGTRRA